LSNNPLNYDQIHGCFATNTQHHHSTNHYSQAGLRDRPSLSEWKNIQSLSEWKSGSFAGVMAQTHNLALRAYSPGQEWVQSIQRSNIVSPNHPLVYKAKFMFGIEPTVQSLAYPFFYFCFHAFFVDLGLLIVQELYDLFLLSHTTRLTSPPHPRQYLLQF